MHESRETPASDKVAWFTAYYKADFVSLTWYVERLGGGSQSEDIAQEAMKALWRYQGQVDNPAAFTRNAARWAVIGMIKKAKRDRALQRTLTDAEPDEPETETAYGEGAQRVITMLRGLPRAQREVFALHMDGWHTDEITEITGQKRDTVRSNLRHARQKLINMLRQQDEQDNQATGKEANDGP